MKSRFFDRVARIAISAFHNAFRPAVFVGNRDRVRALDEQDTDATRLALLNLEWRKMLYGDPSMCALMTHVRFLRVTLFLVMVLFVHLRLIHPDLSTAWNFPIAIFFFLTVLYWAWVGMWYHKIEQHVFALFCKRFGSHYHLH